MLSCSGGLAKLLQSLTKLAAPTEEGEEQHRTKFCLQQATGRVHGDKNSGQQCARRQQCASRRCEVAVARPKSDLATQN